MKHAKVVLTKIRFAFTGFKLSSKTSLIVNRFHRELIIGTRGGLYEKIRIYIENITRWREDMNFIFEWQNNILRTSAASE